MADAEELLDRINRKRNLNGEICINVMADGGQSSFKIGLSVFSENEFDSDKDNQKLVQKYLYSTGGIVNKEMTLTSVYKLLLLCVVLGMKETYSNIQTLFELTKINNKVIYYNSGHKQNWHLINIDKLNNQ